MDNLTPVSQPPEATPDDGPVIEHLECGAVRVDGDVFRGSDLLTATVVEWDTPTGTKGTEPSSVGLTFQHDDQAGGGWIVLTAGGPERAAYLSTAAAKRLLASLAVLLRDTGGDAR